MKDWLNSVRKMAILNGIRDFRFSKMVIQVLAYAYHVNFSPIEAVALLRLVVNKLGDDDPHVVREIEMRVQDLMLIAKPDESYNAELMQRHLSRFIAFAMSYQRRPEPSGAASLEPASVSTGRAAQVSA
jgi:hypothetical protein